MVRYSILLLSLVNLLGWELLESFQILLQKIRHTLISPRLRHFLLVIMLASGCASGGWCFLVLLVCMVFGTLVKSD